MKEENTLKFINPEVIQLAEKADMNQELSVSPCYEQVWKSLEHF